MCIFVDNNLFQEDMEYQKNEFNEPAKKDRTQILAKIVFGFTLVAFLAILGFIVWVGWNVFVGYKSF